MKIRKIIAWITAYMIILAGCTVISFITLTAFYHVVAMVALGFSLNLEFKVPEKRSLK